MTPTREGFFIYSLHWSVCPLRFLGAQVATGTDRKAGREQGHKEPSQVCTWVKPTVPWVLVHSVLSSSHHRPQILLLRGAWCGAASTAGPAATSSEICPSWAWSNSIYKNVTLDSANSPSGQGAETVCHSRITQDLPSQAVPSRDAEQSSPNSPLRAGLWHSSGGCLGGVSGLKVWPLVRILLE